MTNIEEKAYQHLVNQLWEENKMLRREIASLGKLLIKQKTKNYVRKPQ